jgi:hypothetical protein
MSNNVSTRDFLHGIEDFLYKRDIESLDLEDRKKLEFQKRKLVGEYSNKEEYLKIIGFGSESELRNYWNKKIR